HRRRRDYRRADPRSRHIGVRLARVDADGRRPPADGSASSVQGVRVIVLLLMLVQDTVALKPIVITATRTAVPSALVPAATTVLRGADLEARGVRTVAEALELVPGAHIVETGSYGGQTSLFLR